MRAIDRQARVLLHTVWIRTFAKVAAVSIAYPSQIPLVKGKLEVFSYVWTAICTVAPKSTSLMVIATFLGTFCNLALSYAIGKLAEDIYTDQRQVISMALLLLGLWLSAPLLQLLHNVARLFSSQNLRIAVTDHLTARVMYGHPQALARNSVGNLVERVEMAATNVPGVVCGVSDTVVKLMSVALLSSLLLVGISAHLAVLAAIWMFSAVLLSGYLAHSGMSIVEDASDAHSRVIAELTEIVFNVPVIRSFVAYQAERVRFGESLASDLYACRKARSYWLFVLMIETAYKWFFGVSLFVYSVILYNRGILPLPQLITLCSLVISLSWHFESVAFNFVDLFDSLGILSASLRELDSIPVYFPDHPQMEVFLPEPGRVKLTSITAGYEGVSILKDVNLVIESGQKVGIVGRSGSGKSTLLALLRGEIYPTTGSLEIHGVPSHELSAEVLTREFSEASQSAQVFNRSIEENICYGIAGTNSALIGMNLEAAQAKTLVDSLPQGIKTRIGERGASLSTGERQRIAIARALMKQASLLILDEATSSIDAISEAQILDYVLTRLQGVTVIVVSHRISTLSKFNSIVVMDKGRIVDVDTHDALLSRSSHYRNLLFTCEQEGDSVYID